VRDQPPRDAAVALYWLPLGAGGQVVRRCGRAFEALQAWAQARPPARLYHSALEVWVGGERYVIEQAPAWGMGGPRGVVAQGPVGSPLLGRIRLFRYEVRCWRDGVIPDIATAVDSPSWLDTDPRRATRLIGVVRDVPRATWGRDEQDTGEMWNSNSLVSWALLSSGHDLGRIHPPSHGRAPGWDAGVVAAQNDERPASADLSE
jgi:hypothetical protein